VSSDLWVSKRLVSGSKEKTSWVGFGDDLGISKIEWGFTSDRDICKGECVWVLFRVFVGKFINKQNLAYNLIYSFWVFAIKLMALNNIDSLISFVLSLNQTLKANFVLCLFSVELDLLLWGNLKRFHVNFGAYIVFNEKAKWLFRPV